jgi:hypothetical protein
MYSWLGFWGGVLDHIGAFLLRTILPGKSFLFFGDGFGNLESLVEVDSYVYRIVEGSLPVPELSVEWDDLSAADQSRHQKKGCDQRCDLSCGSFTSPAAFFLPEKVHRAHFQLMKPSTPMKGLVIHLPMTGDEWFERRKTLMANDLLEKGYASLILMAPFYGRRRAPNQSKHFIRSVELYLKAAAATMIEAAALVRWSRSAFPSVPVCVAGLSYGGAMASCAACLSHDPLSIVSGVGSESPRALVTGLLSRQISWPALTADRPGRTREAVADELLAVLSARSVGSLVAALARRPAALRGGLRRAACVSASHDAFVRPDDAAALHAAIRAVGRIVGPAPPPPSSASASTTASAPAAGAGPRLRRRGGGDTGEEADVDGGGGGGGGGGGVVEVEWVPGGHATTIALAARLVNPAIVRSFAPPALSPAPLAGA